ncbi:MAG: 30S ribosomal protein S19 [Candidatus Helarchaeota archaeon]|jgi:small subunit ribosomal protein S19|nr:30S ribosomal protein S19 [Candidatus Helarchaeota archaeon]
MVKKYTFRGYTLEELQNLPMDEFIKLLPSRMRRSMLRGLPHRQKKLLENLRRARRALKKGKKVVVRTHARDMVITPEMVGLTIATYNGREFLSCEVTPEHIGHYLGEFSPTIKKVSHGNPGIGATRGSQYIPLK